MRALSLIGIGTGNPEHMTVQGINALNRADVILIPRKGEAKEDLADLRRDMIRFVTEAAMRNMNANERARVHYLRRALSSGETPMSVDRFNEIDLRVALVESAEDVSQTLETTTIRCPKL